MSAFANVPKLDRGSRPVNVNEVQIQDHQLVPMVATYLWFDFLGRQVTREEFKGTMRLEVCGIDDNANFRLFDRLENPSDKLTIAYENAGDELKEFYRIRRVGPWFAQLRQADPVAQARAQDLVGFIGRVPHINRTRKNKYMHMLGSQKNLEGYEILTNYGVINWGKNRKGQAFVESETYQIFVYHYNVDIRGPIRSSLDLADHQNEFTKEIRSLAWKHRQFVEFAAAEMVRRYEMKKLREARRPFRDIIPHRNPDPATSLGLAASTTGATASSSHQPIVPGLSQGIAALSEFSDLALKSLHVELSPDDMLVFGDGKLMPILTYCIIYADWNWIRSDGRLLTFEEIQGILCILYGEKEAQRIGNVRHYQNLYSKLDDNADKASVVLEALGDKGKAILKKEGRRIFDQLLEDPAAKLRDEHLRGFPYPCRMGFVPWYWPTYGKLPRRMFEDHILWDHEVLFIYCLANSCRDKKGEYIPEADAKIIIGNHYGYAITHDQCAVYRALGDVSNPLHRMVTQVMKDPPLINFFEPKAHEAYKYCSKRGMLENPAPLYSDSASEGGLDLAATSGMAAMTMGATASNPRMNPQPGPSGSSAKQPSRKGKERARDSSSGTPPEGHRGVAEGKKPQKKQQRTR